MENVVGHLGYHDLHIVEPTRKSGGLALMCRETEEVKILQSNKRMIDALVRWDDKEFFFTGVYSEPVKNSRNGV